MSKTVIFASHSYSAKTNLINPLAPFFRKNGYDIVFIHINRISGKSDTNEDLGYRHYDLSLTNPRVILDILSKEKPELLICMEFTSLFIILLIRLARLHQVKTLYFEHGIFIKGHGDKFLMRNFGESVTRYRVLAGRYLKFGAVAGMPVARELRTVYRAFFKRDYSELFDFGLFYAREGYEIVKDRFQLPESKAYFAGYPITALNSDIELLKQHHDPAGTTVLYIHQPLIADKLTAMSYADEMEMFYEINRVCNERGLNLVIKLHPRADQDFYEGLDAGKQLTFTVANFSGLLVKSRIIIGQFSTALFNGVVLNIPVITIPYKGLAPSFLENFMKLSFFLEEVSALGALLDEIAGADREKIEMKSKLSRDICGNVNTFENQASQMFKIMDSYRDGGL